MDPACLTGNMDAVSKESIRVKVWDYLESSDIADFPRPVHHRIPNFKGASSACDRLQSLAVYQRARTVKVNPDKPQQQARFMALEANKTLLVPTPRLRKGLFNRIVPPPRANKRDLHTCASSQGVREFSAPVGLDSKVKVDLIIIGSVAVSPKGYRIGKGEGYADMEFAMMSSMGAVTEETMVVTTVHDCQVMDDLPDHLFGDHDLGVDIILTPTRMIRCDNKRGRPPGIVWRLLTRDKFSLIPILDVLRKREAEMGTDVRLKEEFTEEPILRNQNGKESQRGSDVPFRGRFSDAPIKDQEQQEGSQVARIDREPGEGISQPSVHIKTDGRGLRVGVHGSVTSGSGSNENSRTDSRTGSGVGNGSEMSGQRSGQRSSGPQPSTNRRRDLGNMFAWSK